MKKFKAVITRHTVLFIFLTAAVIIIVIRLTNLQIVEGQNYYERLLDVTVKNRVQQGERGLILDRNGERMAYNEKVYDVILYARRKTNAQLNQDILRIYELLEMNGEHIISGFHEYITADPVGYGSRLEADEAREDWLGQMAINENDLKRMRTPQEIFDYFKKEKFFISDGYSPEEAYKIMSVRYEMLIKGIYQLTPYTIAENIGMESVAGIELLKSEIQGLYTDERFIRKYSGSEVFSPITGYIRQIEPEEVDFYLDLGYNLNELVGKDGLEIRYERFLRAAEGVSTAILEPGELELAFETSIEPVSGFDIVTSVDYGVQQAGYDSLKRNIEKIVSGRDDMTNFGDAKYGSAVMIDVRTGGIIALVNYPGYDPNAFIVDDQDEVGRITGGDEKLLFNRTIQGLYPPGSVLKPLTAIAAIEEGAYSPGELVTDEGFMDIEGMTFYGMEYRKFGISYGDIDLKFALKVSANVFFYKTGIATGIENLEKWARRFGLGEMTGIDIGGEVPGRRNSKDTMRQLEPSRIWGKADTAQASIGQLYNQSTPLQLARYTAAIANGGKLYTPRLVTGILKRDGSEVISFEPEFVSSGASADTLRHISEGMLAVANEKGGSAASVFMNFPYGQVAAKTGTPETGQEGAGGSSHSVFICFAPYDDPEVAVCVVIENGVSGENSAPVACDMLIEYFEGGGR